MRPRRQQPGASLTATTATQPGTTPTTPSAPTTPRGARAKTPASNAHGNLRQEWQGPTPPRQNTTIHQGITYNAFAIGITGGANTQSSAGGALTNTVTSTTDSGNTATPPPTHSINTLDHNRCNTYHYRPQDSRRNYPNTRDNRHHRDHKSTNHQPRVARPEPPTTQAQAAPGTNTNNATPTPSDHHETRKQPSITYDILTVGNTSVANIHGTIHTTANPTNNVPRCRHLQHPYHHHHDPST